MSEFAPDIVAFIEARLAEAQTLAEDAQIHPSMRWLSGTATSPIVDVYNGDEYMHTLVQDDGGHDIRDANYIVAWQPKVALEWIEATRRIIESYKVYRDGPLKNSACIGMYVALGEVLIDLAYVWHEHPDWDETWEVK